MLEPLAVEIVSDEVGSANSNTLIQLMLVLLVLVFCFIKIDYLKILKM